MPPGANDERPSLAPVFIGLVLLLLFIGSVTWAVVDTEESEPVRPPRAPEYSPVEKAGLRLFVLSEEREDVVTVPGASFAVAVGESLSPFVPAGAFSAELRGQLLVERRARVHLWVEVEGHCEIHVGEDLVLVQVSGEGRSKRIRLDKGGHALRIVYRSRADGAGSLRVGWEGRRFAREPLPEGALSHVVGSVEFRAELRHEGRELYRRLACSRCHAGPAVELPIDAPQIRDAGSRLRAEWIARWLEDPEKLRVSARMPKLLPAASREREARDIAAFVTSLAPGRSSTNNGEGDVAAGAKLFSELGCIGCHGTPGTIEDNAEFVSLREVDGKFQPGALASFLMDPRARHAGSRMPVFGFSEQEAANLAAYLRSQAVPFAAAGPSQGDADRGRTLFKRRDCHRCHPGLVALEAGDAEQHGLEDLDAGCLAAEPRAEVPNFGLRERQRYVLKSYLERRDVSESTAPIVQSRAMLAELRCIACHQHGGQSDAWTRRADVEIPGHDPSAVAAAQVDQSRPPLDGVGAKLQPDWLRSVIAGAEGTQCRPWLRAQMPSFGAARAKTLARGLVRQAGYLGESTKEADPLPESVAIGKKLVGSEEGFGCVTCHAVAGKQPVAVFEVQGPDLALAARRLRPDWFHRWMMDPPRLWPGTKMPKYADARGRTAFEEILEGEAAAQWRAIWAWLREIGD